MSRGQSSVVYSRPVNLSSPSSNDYHVFTDTAVSNPQEHFDQGHLQTSTQTVSPSFPSGILPSTSQHHHLNQQRGGGYTTYYSPLPLDSVSSPSCSPYPLPTPPLTAPIHPLRSYFFPSVVSQQFTRQDDASKMAPPTHSTNTSYCSNNTTSHETLATALLQLQEPVIRNPAQPTTVVSLTSQQLPHPSSSTLNTYGTVPYSMQAPWRSSWPYLPIMQQQEYRGNPCHICGKTYARLSTLRSHLKSHTGEKPYQCSICQKSFTQAANLTAHLRTHSGEKPFKCPVCHRGFSQSSSVTTHMRTHSGDRPYKCNVCSKGFADSSTLTKHYRTHTGEKPYQCKVCEARFSQSGNLNRHMRTHQQHFGIQPMQEGVPMDVGGVSVGVSIGEYNNPPPDLSKLEMVVLSEGRVSI